MNCQTTPQQFTNEVLELIERGRHALAVARWEGIDGPDVRFLEDLVRKHGELHRSGESATTAELGFEPALPASTRKPPLGRAAKRPHRRFRVVRKTERVAALPREPA
jgi:hypothetical protein